MVIVLSCAGDAHADAVSVALRRFPDLETLDVRVDQLDECQVEHCITADGVVTVFNGRLLNRPVVYNRRGFTWLRSREDDPDNNVRYTSRELHSSLLGMLYSADAIWLNSPSANSRAAAKLLQLRMARDRGIPIPPSICSNQARVLHDRLGNCPLIFKPLGSHFSYDGKVIYTSEIESKSISQDEVSQCTAFLQQRIPKKFDIRVTVVGDELYGACATPNPEDPIDWRIRWSQTKWSPYTLSQKLSAFVFDMTKSLDLRFAAFDFVETPMGEVYFLEVNPNGQWLFVQIDTGFDIASCIARLLVSLQPR